MNRHISIIFAALLLALLATVPPALAYPPAAEHPADPRGSLFSKRSFKPAPLPQFKLTKSLLPRPVYDENPDDVKCYWKAWELAFRNFYQPNEANGFVSPYIDAAFSNYIYLWDTAFMTLFCNFGHAYVPGIQSLDNFYARQHDDGEICREISRTNGMDRSDWVNSEKKDLFSRMGDEWQGKPFDVIYQNRDIPGTKPYLTLDALNHPILAWAELESYRVTGDKTRLAMVYPPLAGYYAALRKYLKQGNGLYVTDWASMDNSPRNGFLRNGGCGIDISAEMVLFARNLADIARIIGKSADLAAYQNELGETSRTINSRMWDPESGFYYDISADGKKSGIKTIAGFWPLLAEVASPEQALALVKSLNDPAEFNRLHRVPTLSAREKSFNPRGGYWQGSVWAPTTTMVVRGLENYHFNALARGIAMNHLNTVVEVFKKTGTIWENYAADFVSQGDAAKPDFVGWSGLAPIMYFIEYAIGIKADALNNRIVWQISSDQRVGMDQFRFNDTSVSLICETAGQAGQRIIKVRADKAFQLVVIHGNRQSEFNIKANENMQLHLNNPNP